MLCVLVTGAVLSSRAAAQEPTSLTGLVSDEVGQPLGSAIVAIDAMNLGTLADERGRYLLIVPASRVPPRAVGPGDGQLDRADLTDAYRDAPAGYDES